MRRDTTPHLGTVHSTDAERHRIAEAAAELIITVLIVGAVLVFVSECAGYWGCR